MNKREFAFEIKELRQWVDPKLKSKQDYVHVTTGTVHVNGEDFFVIVNDNHQPHKMFEVRDSFFRKLIRKIHEVTK